MLERLHDGDGRLGWFRDQDPSVSLASFHRPGCLPQAHSHAVHHLQGVLCYQGLNRAGRLGSPMFTCNSGTVINNQKHFIFEISNIVSLDISTFYRDFLHVH